MFKRALDPVVEGAGGMRRASTKTFVTCLPLTSARLAAPRRDASMQRTDLIRFFYVKPLKGTN